MTVQDMFEYCSELIKEEKGHMPLFFSYGEITFPIRDKEETVLAELPIIALKGVMRNESKG